MTQLLHLRRYVPADYAQVWWLHVEPLRRVGAYLGEGVGDDDLRAIERVYFEDRGEFLVGARAAEPERLLAMGALRKTSETAAEIKRMRVHPDVQGRGYGRQILLALEARAVQLGYTRLHLDTAAVQTAARRLYERAGYHEVRRAPVQGLELIFYEKPLGTTTDC